MTFALVSVSATFVRLADIYFFGLPECVQANVPLILGLFLLSWLVTLGIAWSAQTSSGLLTSEQAKPVGLDSLCVCSCHVLSARCTGDYRIRLQLAQMVACVQFQLGQCHWRGLPASLGRVSKDWLLVGGAAGHVWSTRCYSGDSPWRGRVHQASVGGSEKILAGLHCATAVDLFATGHGVVQVLGKFFCRQWLVRMTDCTTELHQRRPISGGCC